MLQKRKSLTRKEKLNKKSDLLNMFKFAKRIVFPGMKLFYYPNHLNWNRIAIVLKKGFENAVHRNREKRIVKECYRNLKNLLHTGWDIILLIFPGRYSYPVRYLQIKKVLSKADLLSKSEQY